DWREGQYGASSHVPHLKNAQRMACLSLSSDDDACPHRSPVKEHLCMTLRESNTTVRSERVTELSLQYSIQREPRTTQWVMILVNCFSVRCEKHSPVHGDAILCTKCLVILAKNLETAGIGWVILIPRDGGPGSELWICCDVVPLPCFD